jgi:hypothetical protein
VAIRVGAVFGFEIGFAPPPPHPMLIDILQVEALYSQWDLIPRQPARRLTPFQGVELHRLYAFA